jgi:autotransporter-associated beta strand protein
METRLARLEPLEARIAPATLTWDGSADNLWSNSANWDTNTVPQDGDSLVFPAFVPNKNNINDLVGLELASLTLGANGLMTGNGIGLSAGLLHTAMQVQGLAPTVFELAITLHGDQVIRNGQGVSDPVNLILNGPIDLNGHSLSFDGEEVIEVNGAITGDGELLKTGSVQVWLDGANTYTGTTTLAGGLLRVSSGSGLGAFGAADGTVVTGGTLVIRANATFEEAITFSGSGAGGLTSMEINPGFDVTFNGELCVDKTGLFLPGEIFVATGSVARINGGMKVAINGNPPSASFFKYAGFGPLHLNSPLTLAGTFAPVIGTVYNLIHNPGNGTVVGNFSNAPDDALIESNGRQFVINYQPGEGGDVTLTAGPRPFTWDGGGGDGNWQTAANWVGDVKPVAGSNLVFPESAAQKTNSNNFPASTAFGSITIAESGYAISGNAIRLSKGVATMPSADVGMTVLSLALRLTQDQTFANEGDDVLRIEGDVNLDGHDLTLGGGRVDFAGIVSGTGTLHREGSGTTLLAGPNTYTGQTFIHAGQIQIEHPNALGAAGEGNETIIDGGVLVIGAVSELLEPLTLNGDGSGDGSLHTSNDITFRGAWTLSGDAGIKIHDTVAGVDGTTATLAAPLRVEILGVAAHEFGVLKLEIDAASSFTLAGALAVSGNTALPLNSTFAVVQKTGLGTLDGTFTGKPQGSLFSQGGRSFSVGYGGTEVVLTSVSLQSDLLISANGKTATFTDGDGDLVTVKTTKGRFETGDFEFNFSADNRQHLQRLTFDAEFSGTNLTVTAKRSVVNGGNGFVNVGFVDAAGVDLGAVIIGGDLARIRAGDAANPKPAVAALTVQSFGLVEQGEGSTLTGALTKLTVKGDMRVTSLALVGSGAKLGIATIGGSLVAESGGLVISADGGIGSLKVGNDLRTNAQPFKITSPFGPIGDVTVGGSIVGAPSYPVEISAFGQVLAPTKGLDVAIKSLSVRGSVEELKVVAGHDGNADASVGSIIVDGNWLAGSVRAGVTAGADQHLGTTDDSKHAGGDVRDHHLIAAQIGRFTVKGQAFGSLGMTGDMFGAVAERILKAQVGSRVFAFKPDTASGPSREAFFAAPSGPGAGQENPAFDFMIRELGSTTPAVDFGGTNLQISADGKTATYTDVDGDLVTFKTTKGQLNAEDFQFAPSPSGGARLAFFEVKNNPEEFDGARITMTAKPQAAGGNGFVNIQSMDLRNIDLGSFRITGDLSEFFTGGNGVQPAAPGEFFAHSLGVYPNHLPGSDRLVVLSFLPKAAIATDVRGVSVQNVSGSLTIGGSLVNTGPRTSIIGEFIKHLTIKGSVRSGPISGVQFEGMITGTQIGSVTIGGDLIGYGSQPTITARGSLTPPAKGPHFAIQSLIVKGNVEDALIKLSPGIPSSDNADASLGSLSVGREWIASSLLAATAAGLDGFVGTADDRKINSPNMQDEATRYSTIANILIKGQALGTAASNDNFGIVAEQILKAKIGSVVFKLNPGERDAADAFALAPTGPGPNQLTSDFFLREIAN